METEGEASGVPQFSQMHKHITMRSMSDLNSIDAHLLHCAISCLDWHKAPKNNYCESSLYMLP